jgi:cytochrome c oxidase subunit I
MNIKHKHYTINMSFFFTWITYLFVMLVWWSNTYWLACLQVIGHRRIGHYYLLGGVMFGSIGVVLSLIVRVEMGTAHDGLLLVMGGLYSVSITIHGLIMIFFLVMLILFGGFGKYLVVYLVGVSEVTYPKLKKLSVMYQPYSFTFMLFGLVVKHGDGLGWTLYPPLSTDGYGLDNIGVDLITVPLLMSGISSLLTAIKLVVTTMHYRAIHQPIT